MLRPLLLLPLLTTGCEFANRTTGLPDTDTTATSGGCPTGLQVPAYTNVGITAVRQGGVGVNAFFDPTSSIDGQPAACIDASGTRIELLLTIGDQVAGKLKIGATRTGEVNLVDGTGDGAGSFRFEGIQGYFDTDFAISGWTDGTLVINEIGNTFDITVAPTSGTSSLGNEMYFNFFASLDVR